MNRTSLREGCRSKAEPWGFGPARAVPPHLIRHAFSFRLCHIQFAIRFAIDVQPPKSADHIDSHGVSLCASALAAAPQPARDDA